MKPGAMTCPPASTVCPATPESLPISTILPSLTATSPWNDGIPEPSTMRPLRIKRSYAIDVPPCWTGSEACWRALYHGDIASPPNSAQLWRALASGAGLDRTVALGEGVRDRPALKERRRRGCAARAPPPSSSGGPLAGEPVRRGVWRSANFGGIYRIATARLTQVKPTA